MTWFRALVAAGLSVILPGAGHALLRDWVRALLFAGLFVSAVAIFLPTDQLSAASSMTGAVDTAMEGTGTMDRFVLSFIVLFAAIDATIRALGLPRNSSASGDGPTCPQCGRELDEELEFCHWCTTRLEPEPEPDGP
ncbi:zinc ribbon domain-containing protein [Natrononativus amylolyticus]|uniref:zinc ribbon domain-containing protein n=1 Tax=Natrononativus amylolyticus TaxID=2963434 RepID=UPI0020CFCBD3|nr:zinc ribbon domain-containing protein [Natrononativus amylolyticus]